LSSCRVIQVLELGVVVHSLIIGMPLGASDSPSTVRPLVPALTFHQLFEGIGLGGCIVQVSSLSFRFGRFWCSADVQSVSAFVRPSNCAINQYMMVGV
jgi:hypothetical protein